MAEAGLMPQRPWHSRQSDGEVMDGADDCDEQKGFFPEWTVFVRGGNVTDPSGANRTRPPGARVRFVSC